MESRPLGRQLEENGDSAVGLGRRAGEEAVGDLPLHHHAPEPDRRQTVDALHDDRGRDLVGQVGDEFRRRRVEIGEIDGQGVAEDQLDVLPPGEPLLEMRRESAVDLDGVDERDTVGEIASEHAEPGADLQHDVLGPQTGQAADDAEDVLVDEEMLAELPVRDDSTHGREKAAVALASMRAASSFASSPRAAASASTV